MNNPTVIPTATMNASHDAIVVAVFPVRKALVDVAIQFFNSAKRDFTSLARNKKAPTLPKQDWGHKRIQLLVGSSSRSEVLAIAQVIYIAKSRGSRWKPSRIRE
jgi:hypothetical protein